MALGAALATGQPQAYAVVPGPGLLNTGAALLTAYGMNAPVLALIGQIPQAAIGRGLGHLHEIRDQAGIIARLVDFSARIRAPAEAAPSWREPCARCSPAGPDRPRSNARWTCGAASAPVAPILAPSPPPQPPIDEDAVLRRRQAAWRRQAAADRCGGGAQDAAAEVTQLSATAAGAGARPIGAAAACSTAAIRLSVTLPLGRELWGEADVVLGVGTPHVLSVHPMGRRRRSCDHPHRCRSRGAGAVAPAGGGAHR